MYFRRCTRRLTAFLSIGLFVLCQVASAAQLCGVVDEASAAVAAATPCHDTSHDATPAGAANSPSTCETQKLLTDATRLDIPAAAELPVLVLSYADVVAPLTTALGTWLEQPLHGDPPPLLLRNRRLLI